MSSLIDNTRFAEIELWYTSDEQLGSFSNNLECETHGSQLFFTDKSGAEWCMSCMQDRLATLNGVTK